MRIPRAPSHWLVQAALLIVPGACSARPHDCAITRTCPAGDPDGVQCRVDADCANGVQCDGAESCNEGHCTPGTPVTCPSGDNTHCAATCVEGTSSFECVVTPADVDGDGFGSGTCIAAPGIDCDDTRADVYPGAPEVCDDADNDCDGMDDLADGFSLGGTPTPITATAGDSDSGPGLASSLSAGTYGVVWSDVRNGETEIYFTSITGLGERNGPDVRVTDAPGSSAAPRLAHDGVGFGVVWADRRDGHFDIYFQRLTDDGTLSGAPLRLTSDLDDSIAPDIAPLSAGGFIVVWQDQRGDVGDQVYARVISAAGALGSERKVSDAIGAHRRPHVFANEERLTILWSRAPGASETELWSARTDPSLAAFTMSSELGGTTGGVHQGVIGGSTSGYTLAFREWSTEGSVTEDAIVLASYDASGAERCRAAFDWSDTPKVPSAIASYEGGSALAYVRIAASYEPMLQRFNEDCHELGGSIPLGLEQAATTVASLPVLFRTDFGFGAAWAERRVPGPTTIMVRTFGPNFCD